MTSSGTRGEKTVSNTHKDDVLTQDSRLGSTTPHFLRALREGMDGFANTVDSGMLFVILAQAAKYFSSSLTEKQLSSQSR